MTLFAIAPGYNFQMIEIDLGNDGEPEVKNGKIVHLDCTKSSYHLLPRRILKSR